ncbi:MAG: HAD family hydrolase [Huintestinicola sp.]|uniref:HAD family hydrolase n=1 Tax=Huintestinicola sp. TaxID=2981661 RepID=UPI003F024C85
MNGAQGIIFDMDGLMIDSERIINRAVVRAGREMGLSGIEEVSLRTIGTSSLRTREIYSSVYGDFDFDRLMDLKHRYIDEIIGDRGFPPKEGIREMLEYVTEKGYITAVGSSTREWAVKEFLGKIDVLKYFDIFVCGDMGLRSKPFPDIFLACAEKMDVSPGECFVLEDSPNGIRAAYAAGMKPVMIPDMIAPDEDIIPMLYALKGSLTEAMELF